MYEEEQSTPEVDPKPDGKTDEAPKADERRYTQAELNRIDAKTRKDAEKAAAAATEARIAEELGVSVDDAKALIGKQRQKEQDEASDLDRERDAKTKAEKAKADADANAQAVMVTADGYVVRAEAKVQAASLGVPSERLDYVVKLANLSEVSVEDGTPDAEAAKKAVEQVLADVPELAAKTEETQQTTRRAPDSNQRTAPTENLRGADKLRALNW